jgi:hypothetical protein
MHQIAPYPHELADLVSKVKLWITGWSMELVDDYVRDHESTHSGEARGLTLVIHSLNTDAYHPERQRPVDHICIVPAATYNRASWQRWLFEQHARVLLHEAMETFEVDGVRPYAATHGPGDDPYVVHDYADDVQRRTSFLGSVKE